MKALRVIVTVLVTATTMMVAIAPTRAEGRPTWEIQADGGVAFPTGAGDFSGWWKSGAGYSVSGMMWVNEYLAYRVSVQGERHTLDSTRFVGPGGYVYYSTPINARLSLTGVTIGPWINLMGRNAHISPHIFAGVGIQMMRVSVPIHEGAQFAPNNPAGFENRSSALIQVGGGLSFRITRAACVQMDSGISMGWIKEQQIISTAVRVGLSVRIP